MKETHFLSQTRIGLHCIGSIKYGLTVGGGDRGAGDREKRGREVYGRREKRGREAGFPRWREAGEKGENYATLRNISQSKKSKGAGAKKYRAGTGITGYGKREVQTPLSPPPP